MAWYATLVKEFQVSPPPGPGFGSGMETDPVLESVPEPMAEEQAPTPLFQPIEEEAYKPDPETFRAMIDFLNESLDEYALTRIVPSFPFEEKNKQAFIDLAHLATQSADEKYDVDAINAFLQAMFGAEAGIQPVEQPQPEIDPQQAEMNEMVGEGGGFEYFSQLFIQNMSPRMLALTNHPRFGMLISDGAERGLSDNNKFHFFMLNPDTMGEKRGQIEKIIARNDYTARGDALAVARALAADPEATSILDPLLDKHIKNVDRTEVAPGEYVNDDELSPIELYVVNKARGLVGRTLGREGQLPQSEDMRGAGEDWSQGTSAMIDPKDDPAERRQKLLQIQDQVGALSQNVADLAQKSADWVRSYAIRGVYPDKDGEIKMKMDEGKDQQLLLRADVLEVFAEITRNRIKDLTSDENLSSFLARSGKKDFLTIKQKNKAGKTQNIKFEGAQKDRAYQVEWSAPDFHRLVLVEDIEEQFKSLIETKEKILSNQNALDQIERIRATGQSDKASVANIAKPLGVTPWFVEATLRQGKDGVRALKHMPESDTKRLQSPYERFKGYFSHQIINFFPAILQVVDSDRDRYSRGVLDAFFGMTGVHTSLKKPAQFDRNNPEVVKEDTGPTIGGQPNSIESSVLRHRSGDRSHPGVSNAELYWQILGEQMPEHYQRVIEQQKAMRREKGRGRNRVISKFSLPHRIAFNIYQQARKKFYNLKIKLLRLLGRKPVLSRA
jgi:hypothetical protein